MCGVWCVVCGVWCVVCGVWCVVCGVGCGSVCGVWRCVGGAVWGGVCGVWCVVCGGVVVWWCGGVVVWWCGGVVVWWLWWCGGVVVWWYRRYCSMCVFLHTHARDAPNWVAEHLEASSRRPRHPFSALMAGETPGRVPVYTALKKAFPSRQELQLRRTPQFSARLDPMTLMVMSPHR